ncbi:MAG: bacillithiol transferase BstA [Gemmatimonadetes bacterium]|nr:bacillithiol transferase BstA [Gemmatimonadota bacterium]
MDDLRYPVGHFKWDPDLTEAKRRGWMQAIGEAPRAMRAAVKGLTDQQLDTPYRPDGWTVRQVVHHVADSHLNAYVRFRLALTEENPTIKPYEQTRWAELSDARSAPVSVSLNLLDSVHERWSLLLKSLAPADFARTFLHPESGPQTLDSTLQLYAWHSRHHVAHITSLRERMGW